MSNTYKILRPSPKLGGRLLDAAETYTDAFRAFRKARQTNTFTPSNRWWSVEEDNLQKAEKALVHAALYLLEDRPGFKASRDAMFAARPANYRKGR